MTELIVILSLLAMIVVTYLVIAIPAILARRRGESCFNCIHHYNDTVDDLCGRSLGHEPTPYFQVCSSWEPAQTSKYRRRE